MSKPVITPEDMRDGMRGVWLTNQIGQGLFLGLRQRLPSIADEIDGLAAAGLKALPMVFPLLTLARVRQFDP